MLNKYFWAAFSWTVFITVLSLMSTNNLEKMDVLELPHKDKLVHFSFYFVFTITWYLFFKNRYGSNAKTRFSVFMTAVAYGGLIEIIQLLFASGRNADVLDAVANTIGSASGILIIWLYKKLKQ